MPSPHFPNHASGIAGLLQELRHGGRSTRAIGVCPLRIRRRAGHCRATTACPMCFPGHQGAPTWRADAVFRCSAGVNRMPSAASRSIFGVRIFFLSVNSPDSPMPRSSARICRRYSAGWAAAASAQHTANREEERGETYHLKGALRRMKTYFPAGGRSRASACRLHRACRSPRGRRLVHEIQIGGDRPPCRYCGPIVVLKNPGLAHVGIRPRRPRNHSLYRRPSRCRRHPWVLLCTVCFPCAERPGGFEDLDVVVVLLVNSSSSRSSPW